MGKENQKESLLDRFVLGSLTTLLNAFAQLHKLIIVGIIFKLEERIYPSAPFDYKGFKLEKKIVYGGPRLEELIKQRGGSTIEELMKRDGIMEIKYPEDFDSLLKKVKNTSSDEYFFLRRIEYEAQNMYSKYSNSFFDSIKDAFIKEAKSRRWIAELKPGHHFPFDPIQVRTLKGRRNMVLYVDSGIEIPSVSIESGGFRHGLILDERITSYLNSVCKRLYSKPCCVKNEPYEELKALVIIPNTNFAPQPLQLQLQAL